MVTSKKTVRIIVHRTPSGEVPPPVLVREGPEITGTIFRSRRQETHGTTAQQTNPGQVSGKESLPMSSDPEAVAPAGRVPVPSPTGSASKATVRTETGLRDKQHPEIAATKGSVSERGNIGGTTARPEGESTPGTAASGTGTAPGAKSRLDNHLEALCGALAIACVLFALVWGFALLNAITG